MPRLGGGPAPRAAATSSSSSSSSSPKTSPGHDALLQDAAAQMDARIFEPWFESEAGGGELQRSMTNKFADYKSFSQIDLQLRKIKVGCLVGSVLCAGMAVSSFLGGRLAHALIYAVSAHDLLRVSYNCFIKRYCARAATRLGGSILEAAGNVLLNVVNSALFGQPDVVSRLQREVLWDVLFDDTLAKRALDALPRGAAKGKVD